MANPRLPSVNWRFFLANSSTMSYIGEITSAHDKSLSVALNKSGNFSCRLKQDDRISTYVNPITTCVIALKNGVAVWSGPVWTIEDQLPDKSTQINCVGWYELLMHRLLLSDVIYTSTDAGTIAQSLITTTNLVAPTGITPGSLALTQSRTKNYKKYQNIGQEIQALAEIESGYDWYIDPLTKSFSIYSQLMTTRTNVVYGYHWGPNNISNLSRTIDSSTLVNTLIAIGRNGASSASDATSQGTYGTFQETASLSEVVDNTILAAYANAEIAIRSTPRVIYKITPAPIKSTDNTVFSLFEDYTIGDKIYFVCNYGRIATGNSPQAIRVFGATINIDDNGVERISELQTSPA